MTTPDDEGATTPDDDSASSLRDDRDLELEPEPELELVIVAAIAENGVIGGEGGIPWYYPEDLRHFKETTMGHPVIMGRRTFEGIVNRLGEPLPGRTNVVLSRGNPDLPSGVVHAQSVADAVDAARDAARDDGVTRAYVIGGASVYEQCLPIADRMIVTEIPETPAGDTYFPEWDPRAWVEVDREERDDLAFVTYERRGDDRTS